MNMEDIDKHWWEGPKGIAVWIVAIVVACLLYWLVTWATQEEEPTHVSPVYTPQGISNCTMAHRRVDALLAGGGYVSTRELEDALQDVEYYCNTVPWDRW